MDISVIVLGAYLAWKFLSLPPAIKSILDVPGNIIDSVLLYVANFGKNTVAPAVHALDEKINPGPNEPVTMALVVDHWQKLRDAAWQLGAKDLVSVLDQSFTLLNTNTETPKV